MSLIVIILTLIYAPLKLVDLIKKEDPQINISTQVGYYKQDETLNLNDIGFRVGFDVGFAKEPYSSLEDPRYVKWIAELWKAGNYDPEGKCEKDSDCSKLCRRLQCAAGPAAEENFSIINGRQTELEVYNKR